MPDKYTVSQINALNKSPLKLNTFLKNIHTQVYSIPWHSCCAENSCKNLFGCSMRSISIFALLCLEHH